MRSKTLAKNTVDIQSNRGHRRSAVEPPALPPRPPKARSECDTIPQDYDSAEDLGAAAVGPDYSRANARWSGNEDSLLRSMFYRGRRYCATWPRNSSDGRGLL